MDNPWYTKAPAAREVLAVILPSFLLTVIAKYLTNIFLKTEATIHRFLLEFAVIIVPLVLVFTVLTNYIAEVLFTLSCLVITLVLLSPELITRKKIEKNQNTSTYLGFVSNARSTINILTGIAILAVDFRIFPRRFAKTKRKGFSLMDVGVGLFVFSNGIVSPEVRGCKNSLGKTLKSVLALFLLGVIRYLMTSLIGYRVNVEEYGVHWNFFITLAVTKLLSSCILTAIDIKYIWLQGVLLLITHEVLLQLALDKYVFSSAPRIGFISANREGLCSTLGYVALHFLSIEVGKWFHTQNALSKKILFAKLTSATIILLLATIYTYNEYNISRCLANITYCLWVLFIGVLMTTLYYLNDVVQDYIFGPGNIQVPIILESINYNGLVYFFVSNLLTGLVNIGFKTKSIGVENSLLILFSYMFITCLFIVVLYVYRIKLKL